MILLVHEVLAEYKGLANRAILVMPQAQANELGVEAVEILTKAQTELNRISKLRNIG